MEPIPEINTVCHNCRIHTAIYIFVLNDKEYQIRASDVELATLRAWKVNPDLKFKGVGE